MKIQPSTKGVILVAYAFQTQKLHRSNMFQLNDGTYKLIAEYDACCDIVWTDTELNEVGARRYEDDNFHFKGVQLKWRKAH